ncbi:MAG: glycosyltransferase, partial [Thermoplasmata archaeon]|nr:glycosyltransferase [Thermoplasmata archaeon]
MDTEESKASSPHLTVVIPTYNMGDIVGEAIKSVLQQTYADLELIVVDDGSTDDTHERLQAIDDPRMRVIELERRGGTVAAMN